MPDTEDHVGQERLKFQLEVIGHHIQLLQEEARAEKESTKEMVSDISHQLKTPVAALDTCFSILLRNNLSETEQQEFRIRCRSALDGLETLLQSLLEISKLETGLIQLDQKTLPIMDTNHWSIVHSCRINVGLEKQSLTFWTMPSNTAQNIQKSRSVYKKEPAL